MEVRALKTHVKNLSCFISANGFHTKNCGEKNVAFDTALLKCATMYIDKYYSDRAHQLVTISTLSPVVEEKNIFARATCALALR